jgi:Xaa-Pro dipeptidase
MNTLPLDQARSTLQQKQLDGLLLSDPASITWLTGFAPPIEIGVSPFEAGMLLWIDLEQILLVLPDTLAGGFPGDTITVVDYTAYTFDARLDPAFHLRKTIGALLHTIGNPRRIGVEVESLAGSLYTSLTAQSTVLPIDRWNVGFRAIKTPDELLKLRAALALSDLAQQVAHEHVMAGITELELFHLVRGAMENHVGERVPVLADLVSGIRAAAIGGNPTFKLLEPNDVVLLDVVPRYNGYWGDTCNIHSTNSLPAALQPAYRAVEASLDAAIAAIRPGVKASEIDTIARKVIRDAGFPDYPHHTGHGIGVTFHEEPRIVAYNDTPLEADMIIALEPGIYIPQIGGIRLEDVVRVTRDGCEVLTHHRRSY